MSKKVIIIGGEKGGTGKSTLAVNLSIMLKLMDHDVLLIDSDKQSSSRNFISHRNERGIDLTPPCIQILGQHLRSEIENLATKYEYIVIDAGGRDSIELRSAMACAAVSDLYSPIQASEFDLETLSTMDELTYISSTYNNNLKTHIIFNLCSTHAKSTNTEEAIDVVKSFDNLLVANTKLCHRVAFSYSKSTHLSVVEFELKKISTLPTYQAKRYADKASYEICTLYEEIFDEKFNALPLNFLAHSKKEADYD